MKTGSTASGRRTEAVTQETFTFYIAPWYRESGKVLCDRLR